LIDWDFWCFNASIVSSVMFDYRIVSSLMLDYRNVSSLMFDYRIVSSIMLDYHIVSFLMLGYRKWWKKPECPERTTDHGQATGKLYHLRLRVECTCFVIYKGGCELTPYW
jgi:hypothetical protein